MKRSSTGIKILLRVAAHTAWYLTIDCPYSGFQHLISNTYPSRVSSYLQSYALKMSELAPSFHASFLFLSEPKQFIDTYARIIETLISSFDFRISQRTLIFFK